MATPPSFIELFLTWIRNSVTLKLIFIGILVLILLIPQEMVRSLVYEREHLRDEVTDEVSSKWGKSQQLTPPILTVPYKITEKNERGDITYRRGYAHFLPEKYDVKGNLDPETRYRSLYMAVVYKSNLTFKGTFKYPDFSLLGISLNDYYLNEAFISFGISDLKGLQEHVRFQCNQDIYEPAPGLPNDDIINSGLSFKIKLDPQTVNYNFSYSLNLRGSKSLYFLPFAKENTVQIQSTWANPSFEGSFLPQTRNVTAQGFQAQWKVLSLNRNYPQQGIGSFIGKVNSDKTNDVAGLPSEGVDFGVRFMLPVDEYAKITRSIKYGTMFLMITFITFFFIEVLQKKRIHPIQYLLIGFAIILFYVLLLSVSEHLSFGIAYLIGSATITVLLGYYTFYVLNNPKLTTLFIALLVLLYGFFYSLLQLENYALLVGSIGLLLILATVMYLTKNINWYGLQDTKE